MNDNCIVLSIRGWDGTTILGTYSSVKEAKEAGRSYIISGNKLSDVFAEEIVLDITTPSLVATSKEINTQLENKITVITKTHRYT